MQLAASAIGGNGKCHAIIYAEDNYGFKLIVVQLC